MQIPNWSKNYLKANRVQLITDAVKKAENKTSGEIVPMIVRRSSTVGHVPVIFMTLVIAVFFGLDVPHWQHEFLGEHWAWYLADVVLLLGLSTLFSKFNWIQRLFTSRPDQADQVSMRAEVEFYESGIKNTKDATGVLLFVSLMERRAVVLADKAINDKVSKETWQNVCDLLINGIKQGNLGLAFAAAIEKCGEILTPHFPIQPDDINELKDQLIIKE